MSYCKKIKNKIKTEIKELDSKSNLDMSNLLKIAEKIPCRKPSKYNIHISECMKEEGSTLKKCALKWNEKKQKSLYELEKQEKRAIEVTTKVSGEGVRAKASYDPQTDTSSIAVVDEDPDKIQIIAQSIPTKIDKVIVEELPSGGVTTIKTEGKEEIATIVSDLPIYQKES
ncbi:MAG: hypothetical protein ACXADY_20770 [Candidatus Hodarchaeales archaeon]|jgi:hypothetical protein